jgi:hypothetical protein
MKPNDPLDSLLQTWSVEVTEEKAFHDAVWRRIAAQAESGGNVISMSSGLRQALLASAAAVIVGFSIGVLTPADSVESSQNKYFARINPLRGT